MIQEILAFLVLLIALGYVIKKFLLPKSLFSTSKKTTKSCGNEGCGCE